MKSEQAQEWHLTENSTGMVSLMLAPDLACRGPQFALTAYNTPLRPTAAMPG